VITVLVCDDQALVRAGFATILGAQPDMTVVGEASDGQAAVTTAARLRPDVVVMDVRMPGWTGCRRPGCWPPGRTHHRSWS
jgi:DNA-binding NarL/FixJ family response regulator